MEEQGQPADERSSLMDRGKGAVRKVTKPLTDASDLITGRGLEQSVAEYSETFTQVVLGIHEDVTALSRRVSELETDSRDKMAQTQRLKRAYLLGYSAIAISLIALGVALWSLL